MGKEISGDPDSIRKYAELKLTWPLDCLARQVRCSCAWNLSLFLLIVLITFYSSQPRKIILSYPCLTSLILIYPVIIDLYLLSPLFFPFFPPFVLTDSSLLLLFIPIYVLGCIISMFFQLFYLYTFCHCPCPLVFVS